MTKQPLYLHRVFLDPPVKNEDTTFRPGLNVIWAESGAKGAANSVGKTTLKDLIDYGLGKTEFIAKDKFDLLAHVHNRTLVLQFACHGQKLTLRRDLVPGDSCLVWEGWHDKVPEGVSTLFKGPLEQYKFFLENRIWDDRNRADESTKISLRQLLDLLIRDQKQGFAALNRARPNEQGKVTETRLAFLLGFIGPDRVKIQRELDEATKLWQENKGAPKVLSKFLASQAVGENQVRWELGPREKKLAGLLRQRHALLNRSQEQGGSVERATTRVLQLQRELEGTTGAIMVTEARAQQYYRARSEAFTEMDKLADLAAAMSLFAPLVDRLCPVCDGVLAPELLNQLPPNCPVHRSRSQDVTDEAIAQRLIILQYEVDDLQQGLEQLQTQISSLSGHQRALSEIAAVAQKELADITRDGTDALKDLDDEIRLLESEISTLRSTSELYKRRDQLLDDLKVYRRRRLVAQQKLDDHKQGEKSRRLDFATIYHSVITWLYVNQRRGVMDLNTLVPDIHMSRYEAGHDSGAAALPIATVAFDLALLEYGLTFGQSEHPRLLVHDSPALFEIDPNVYARVFDWIIERESTLSDEDTFQYIITTIHLPERLRNVPDVIRKHLRGDTPDGKLLGLDY